MTLRAALDDGPACVCGGSRYVEVLTGTYRRLIADPYDFTVARCSSCGLARTFPVPDARQYAGGFSLTTRDGAYAGSPIDAWSGPIVDFVAARMTGTRLLDVGSGAGNLVAAAAARGLSAEGIDVDPVATAEGRRLGRRVLTGSVDDLTGRYDAIVVNHVIEHVAEPVRFIARLERLLEIGGRLFLFVPHHRGFVPRLMRARWMGWFPTQHVWHFTPATLVDVVARASSLRLVECTTRGAIEPPSAGVKGLAKAAVTQLAVGTNRGDEIEAVFERAAN
jgi:2-polyprenyl-3-methyl-5-hydroxy-6-metoxy-1,4-benzoquinol methylase